MSALTSIFNFLYVYLINIFGFITGCKIYLSSFNDEQLEIVKNGLDSLGFGYVTVYYQFTPRPILIFVLGVFLIGSLICLVRRLIR